MYVKNPVHENPVPGVVLQDAAPFEPCSCTRPGPVAYSRGPARKIADGIKLMTAAMLYLTADTDIWHSRLFSRTW